MLYINAVGTVSALGANVEATVAGLSSPRNSYLSYETAWRIDQKPCWLGAVHAPLPLLAAEHAVFNSRNNRLLLAAYQQIAEKVMYFCAQYGSDRIGIVLGTSTSGVAELEETMQSPKKGFYFSQQEFGDPAAFLAQITGITGPSYCISTACTSSSRAFISGYRMIQAGLVDAVIVGGVDTLCQMTVNGFSSLEALAPEPSYPFSQNRSGINMGEASALCILSCEPDAIVFKGFGESSDAWHISAPHPKGIGVMACMEQALARSGVQASQVGYINLHGTGTLLNDDMEARAVHQVFGSQTWCSSTKYLTGHTLAAAGATEAIISVLLLQHHLALPEQLFHQTVCDPALDPIRFVCSQSTFLPDNTVIMSNSFAFGGNNTSLIFGYACNE